MRKNLNVIESPIKLALAVVAIFYPVVSLIEPASDVISDVLKTSRSLSKFEQKKKKELNSDLKACVKNTLEAMRNEVPTDTARKAMKFLEPYIEMVISKTGVEGFTNRDFEHVISRGLKRKEVSDEIYQVANDIKYLHDLFYEKFSIHILDFSELSAYYNQCNIKANSDNIQKLWRQIEDLKNQRGDNTTREELKEMLSFAFEHERKNNPSVENISFSEDLLPRGKVNEFSITANINKERVRVPVCEFFSGTWKDTNQNHISVTGIGGIGKTVTLFNQAYPAPTIYIPLRDLAVSSDDGNQEYITKYIKENTLKSCNNAFNALLQLCNEPWKNGPRIILLLDGFNEVTSSKFESVVREIRTTWAKKQGVQLVLTSRYDINAKLQLKKVHQVLIDPLSINIIRKYLIDANVDIPMASDRLWEIIDTPLMLMLYSKSESIRLSHNSEYANWKTAQNGGSIMWNYLQSELCRASFHNKLESIVAIHFFAPFICHKMMANNLFNISISTFKKYISEAVALYNKLKGLEILPTIIVKAIDENEESNINTLYFYNLLTKNFNIFRSRGETIQLVHQHFRDCLAAIHIIQVAENAINIPDEWKTDFGLYVREFICDLLLTEDKTNDKIGTWKKIWSFKYQKQNNTFNFTNKMLNIYKKVYGNDISQIDFSDVDLRQIPLNTFKLTKNSKNHFVNSRLGHDTFFGSGHSDTVCSTSWGVNDKYYISASHDCTIRIYNTDNYVLEVLDGLHKHYIRCAKCSPVNQNVIASAGDDQQLICWIRTELSSDTGETTSKWIPKIWGKCSNWIRSLQWDKKGQRIVCGDGGGNIRLFDNIETIDFDHKHCKNVRHLTWLECEDIAAIASGSDDGMFCIWTENGNCVFDKCLGSPITSINWVQGGMYLVVSTSIKIHFYHVNYPMQEDNHTTRIVPVLVKEFTGDNISYITSSNLGALDYIAIFDNNSLKILSLFNIDGELQIDEIGNCLYDGETNKIITAEWNHTCDKIICGSRDGSVSCVTVLKNEENNQRILFDVVGRRCCKAARCSSWSPNGQWLAVGYDDCAIRIWDPFKERCLAVLKAHVDSVKSLAWAPDSSSIVSGSDDNEVKIWTGTSITHLKQKTVFKHKEPVNAVLWLKNNTVISTSDDGSLAFINTDNLENTYIKNEHSQRVYSLTASPNEDYIISGGNDRYIVLWSMKTLLCHKYDSGHQLPIRAVDWSNDGKFIISSSNDCTIALRYFDAQKGVLCNRLTHFPKMHEDFIYGANISGNDLYVIGGSTDSTVGFWKIPSTDFIYKSNVHKDFVWNVSSSPQIVDKFYVATSSSDGTVKIWDVSNPSLDTVEPCFNLPVIPEIDVVGCDFSGAIIENSTLKDMLIANGGILN